jgi:hypothetical protein
VYANDDLAGKLKTEVLTSVFLCLFFIFIAVFIVVFDKWKIKASTEK